MEEQFYLVLPFIVAWFGPIKSRNIVLTIAVAMPFVRVGSYHLFPHDRSLIALMFHTTADRLLWGSLLALFTSAGAWGQFTQSAVFRSRAAFFAVAMAFLFLLPHIQKNGGAPFMFVAGFTIRALCVVFVIVWLGQNPGSLPAKFLNLRGIRVLGLLSYSIYLWQQLILCPHSHLFDGLFPLAVAICCGVGGISYLVAEAPFVAMRKRLGGHRKTSAAPPLSPATKSAEAQTATATAQ